MAPKARMDLELRYNALSHQSLLWIDSYGKAKVIAEMPLPYVQNVLNVLFNTDFASASHPLVIALEARAEELAEPEDDEDFDEDESDDDESGDEDMEQISADELLELLKDAPPVVQGLVKMLDKAGALSAYKVTPKD